MALSIICPVINNWKYTKSAIESIKTKEKFEVLIIDQESNDETQTELKNLNINNIRNSPRVSLSQAWNQGVRRALKNKSEYIFIINNDIVLHPRAIDFVNRSYKYKSPINGYLQ